MAVVRMMKRQSQSMFDFLGEGKLNSDSAEKYSIKCLRKDSVIRRQCGDEGHGAMERSEGSALPLAPHVHQHQDPLWRKAWIRPPAPNKSQ